MFSWYGRIRYIGETFIEYPSTSYGRRWLDFSFNMLDVEVWMGRLHITFSLSREPGLLIALLAALVALAIYSARFLLP
jgi:hypothetical protein